jgi:hypothetical protein
MTSYPDFVILVCCGEASGDLRMCSFLFQELIGRAGLARVLMLPMAKNPVILIAFFVGLERSNSRRFL